jgi:hypothetical protein
LLRSQYIDHEKKKAKPNDLPLLFHKSYGESEKRKNIGPWAFFQGRPLWKARLSYKQALRLWSGWVEIRRPEALLMSLQKSAL